MNSSLKAIKPKERLEEFRLVYDELVSVLKQQINSVQQGDIDKLEQLAHKSGEYIERIEKMEILDGEDFINELNELRGLYSQLCLSVGDQKQKTSNELNQIHKVKSTLSVYRTNI